MGVQIDLYKVSGRRRYLNCPAWLKLRLLREMRRASLQNDSNAFHFHPLGWKLTLDDCVPLGESQLLTCRNACWVSVAAGRLIVWERGSRRREVQLASAEVPRCVDCRRVDENLYVALGMESGVTVVRFGQDDQEVWSPVTRGKCLAVDVVMAPRYVVCLMEREGVLVVGRGGVFRLSDANPATSEPVDIKVPQLAMGCRHGEVFDANGSLQNADYLLSTEERVLSTKCIPGGGGVIMQTSKRLVSVRNSEVCTIACGSPCFCYDGFYLYAAEQHLYGTCFTIYRYSDGEWRNMGYYDIRANFGIRKVLSLNVSNTKVQLLGERNELYAFDIQPASYE